MTLYDDTLSLVSRLSTYDKVRLMEHISESLKQELEDDYYQRMPWDEFVERTAGSLADDPIRRWLQGSYEERDPVE
jgi:hypothetical protein